MNLYDATDRALEKIIEAMEQAPRRRPKVMYANLNEESQREAVGKYCKGNTRTISEAISDDECVLQLILQAYTAHDTADIGRIVAKAISDYHEPIIKEVEL